jgi:hypothetical protein
VNTNKKKSNLALKIIGIAGICFYILFLIEEGAPIFKNASFKEYSVYLLFAIFLFGIYLLWKNLIISGLTLILWHLIQWSLVLWIWVDGAMTLIFGFPAAIFGIVVLIIGIVQKKKHKTLNSK